MVTRILAIMAALLAFVVIATVAYAANINCPGGYCYGTSGNDDPMNGTSVQDLMFGYGGNDYLLGYAGNDSLEGGSGNDALDGGDGPDNVNDNIIGGEGANDADKLLGGAGDDIINAVDYDPWDDIDCGSGYDKVWLDNDDSAQNCEEYHFFK